MTIDSPMPALAPVTSVRLPANPKSISAGLIAWTACRDDRLLRTALAEYTRVQVVQEAFTAGCPDGSLLTSIKIDQSVGTSLFCCPFVL